MGSKYYKMGSYVKWILIKKCNHNMIKIKYDQILIEYNMNEDFTINI